MPTGETITQNLEPKGRWHDVMSDNDRLIWRTLRAAGNEQGIGSAYDLVAALQPFVPKYPEDSDLLSAEQRLRMAINENYGNEDARAAAWPGYSTDVDAATVVARELLKGCGLNTAPGNFAGTAGKLPKRFNHTVLSGASTHQIERRLDMLEPMGRLWILAEAPAVSPDQETALDPEEFTVVEGERLLGKLAIGDKDGWSGVAIVGAANLSDQLRAVAQSFDVKSEHKIRLITDAPWAYHAGHLLVNHLRERAIAEEGKENPVGVYVSNVDDRRLGATGHESSSHYIRPTEALTGYITAVSDFLRERRK